MYQISILKVGAKCRIRFPNTTGTAYYELSNLLDTVAALQTFYIIVT
jgi:hypothetical protein